MTHPPTFSHSHLLTHSVTQPLTPTHPLTCSHSHPATHPPTKPPAQPATHATTHTLFLSRTCEVELVTQSFTHTHSLSLSFAPVRSSWRSWPQKAPISLVAWSPNSPTLMQPLKSRTCRRFIVAQPTQPQPQPQPQAFISIIVIS